MKQRVVCTSPTFGKYSRRAEEMLADEGLSLERVPRDQAGDQAAMKGYLREAVALIAGAFKVSREVMAESTNLRIMTKHGTGVDHFDLDAAREMGVVVANAPGLNANAVADLALGLILSVARHIPHSAQGARRGEWKPIMGTELTGKTLGVIGLGAIGKGLIKRARGFGMSFIAYDMQIDEAFNEAYKVHMVETVHQLISECDFLSLHVPLTAETRGLIGAAELSAMKKTAYLINTSRGGIVDEAALAKALEKGEIAGAGLDVLAQEPPPVDHPLLATDRAVVTQHMAAYTEEAMASISEVCALNIIRVLKGSEPLYRVV